LRADYLAGGRAEDLSRGLHDPPDNAPAHWSDGNIVTAQDFVYSWRRLFAPKTASPNAEPSAYMRNALAIVRGQTPTRATRRFRAG
jgi:hypothetical protein